MASSNEQLEDWSNTNALNILRVAGGVRKKTIKELEKLEKDIVQKIATASPSKKASLQNLLKDTSASISQSYKTIGQNHYGDLEKLAKTQIKGVESSLNGAIGVPIFRRQPTETQINAVMKRGNVEGHSSGAWWKEQEKNLRFKFEGQMRQGYLAGEDVGDLAKRVRGTKANNYKDGIMNVSKAQAEALVRSSVQTVSNEARLATYEENSDLVKEIKWMATLDGRTTNICKALDGLRWSLPDYEPQGHDKQFPGPTAHWGCRSTQVSILPSLAELTGKPIKEMGDEEFQSAVDKKLIESGMSEKQRKAAVVRTRASMDGQVPKTQSYNDWLKTKPEKFQDQVLGPSRARLFREGNLQMADLTNQDNRPLTVEQLEAAIDSEVFGFDEIAVETEGVPDEVVIATAVVAESLEDKISALPKGTIRKLADDGSLEKVDAVFIEKLGKFEPIGSEKLKEYDKAFGQFLTNHIDTETFSIDELKLNTAKIEKSSLDAFVKDPSKPKNGIVVIRDIDGSIRIIRGHDEWVAAKLAGDKEVKVSVVDVKQYEAEKVINDVLKNPKTKGNKVLGESIEGLKKTYPKLDDATLLEQAKGMAIEKQAQLTKASNLSKAKKAFIDGKKPGPKAQEAFNDLSIGDQVKLMQDVNDKIASKELNEQTKVNVEKLKKNLEIYANGTPTQKKAYAQWKELYPDGSPDKVAWAVNNKLEKLNNAESLKQVESVMAKPNAAQKKAFEDLTGWPAKEWKNYDTSDWAGFNEKLEVLTVEKQAQLTEASNLSKAKKALAEGKKPSKTQQKIIDGFNPGELDEFNLQVEEKKAKLAFDSLEKGETVNTKIPGLQKAIDANDAKIQDLQKQIADTKKQIEATETVKGPDLDIKNKDLYFPEPDQLDFVRDLSGSTAPKLMVDPSTGKQWVVKSDSFENNLDKKALISEATADKIYREMGAKVPGSKTFTKDGKTYKLAEYIDNSKQLGEYNLRLPGNEGKVNRQLQEHFVLDALLGNRDVAGQTNDNILVTADGRPFRVDNGASLSFRAQGAKKDSKAWGPEVGELKSMRDPAIAAGEGKTAKIFEGLTENEINDQIKDIVKNKSKILNIASETQTVKDVRILEKRIDYLEKQLPPEQTQAVKNAARKAREAALESTQDPSKIAKRALNARINGTPVDIGSKHVEDMQGLAWQETTLDGNKKTIVQLKLTDEGAASVRSVLPQADIKDISGNGMPSGVISNIHPEDKGYQVKMESMVKTIYTHSTDKQFNAGTVVQFQKAKDEIEQALYAEIDKNHKLVDKEKVKMLEHYKGQADKLQKLYDHLQKKNGISAELAVKIPKESYLYVPPKVKPKKNAANTGAGGFTGTASNSIVVRSSRFKNGEAINDGGIGLQYENTKAKVYKLTLEDGTKIEYIDRLGGFNERRGLALEGQVTIELDGPVDSDKITKAISGLERLGVDTKPGDANYKEMVWLNRTVNVHNDSDTAGWRKIQLEPDIEKRIAEGRKWIEKRYETKVPKRGDKAYTADGVPNSFGEGRKVQYRADVTREMIESDPRTKDIALFHAPFDELEDTLDKMLQSGGEFTPTNDRLRKGVPVQRPGEMKSGTSPVEDIATGGSATAFTRQRLRSVPQENVGMYFKGGNLARADAIAYAGDQWGRISELSQRKSTLAEFGELAKEGSRANTRDETDFKGGLFIPDEIDYFVALNDAQRDRTIAVLKKNGLAILPDGRKAEDLVIIRKGIPPVWD